MASLWPSDSDVLGGDEPTRAPTKNDRSLLAALRDGQLAKRLETDVNNNLYVRVAADDSASGLSVSPLVVGAVTGVTATTLTTIVTYTAASAARVSRISVSGTLYAKFQLFLNTTLIETKRSGPSRELDFVFSNPLNLAATDILDVKVTHYQTGNTGDFEATVYGG